MIDRLDPDKLDRWITGNYGENQSRSFDDYEDDPEIPEEEEGEDDAAVDGR